MYTFFSGMLKLVPELLFRNSERAIKTFLQNSPFLCRLNHYIQSRTWGCSSAGRTSDRYAADAGSISRCGKRFFSQSQLAVQTLLRCPYTPVRNHMPLHLCECQRFQSPCQSSMDYGNTKTTTMNRGFPRGRQPDFPMGEIPFGQYISKR